MDNGEVVHTYHGILHSHKKGKIVLFVTTWIDLESILLNKSDRKGQEPYDIIIWDIKEQQTNNFLKNPHRYRQENGGYPRGRERTGKVKVKSTVTGGS